MNKKQYMQPSMKAYAADTAELLASSINTIVTSGLDDNESLDYEEVYRRRQWHPAPVLLPGKSHGRRSWWAAVHGVAKSQTRLSDFPFTFLFHALEEEMATHSSVFAWRVPGMGEPGGLPSMGSHRVGHD